MTVKSVKRENRAKWRKR